MQREIKFRGKRIDNGEWVYGGYYTDGDKHYIITEIANKDSVMPDTIGQYTGLHDKNGRETYEGDILKASVGKVIIKFGEYTSPSGLKSHVGFYPEFIDEDDDNLYRKDIWYLMPQSVIIGTVWDNPEVLKEVSV